MTWQADKRRKGHDPVLAPQDDGHIFCLPSQTAAEIRGVLDLVEEIMGAFGFKEYEVVPQNQNPNS